MRRPMPLFLVSAALFVCGVACVVLAAGAVRRQPNTPPAVERARPVASVTHIMRGIVDPAATVVFDAVSTTVTAAGIDVKVPVTDAEWNSVVDSAAALAEAGTMLLAEGRAVDRDGWVTWSRALTDAGVTTLRAAEKRDADGVFASGEAVYEACDNCHRTYRRTE